MKIALCLSGYFNSSKDKSSLGKDGFKYIKKNILDCDCDCDVFIHSWDFENQFEILKLYKKYIHSVFFEKQKDFKYIFNNNKLNEFQIHGTPFYNSLSQFYSVQKSFELMINSEVEYDCVIKSRFDLGRINRKSSGPGKLNPFPVQCINFSPKLDMNNFYLANWNYFESEGPPDMWFYSNMANMRNFAKIFDILCKDIKVGSEYQEWAGKDNGGMVNTIKAWKWFLIKSKLWEIKHPLNSIWE